MTPTDYIKAHLRRANVTPNELATKIGFSKSQVADILNDRIEVYPKFIDLLHHFSGCLELEIERDFLYYLCGLLPPRWQGLDEDSFQIAAEGFRCTTD
jgi:transcriptional regulator with XRE-family HTH domain